MVAHEADAKARRPPPRQHAPLRRPISTHPRESDQLPHNSWQPPSLSLGIRIASPTRERPARSAECGSGAAIAFGRSASPRVVEQRAAPNHERGSAHSRRGAEGGVALRSLRRWGLAGASQRAASTMIRYDITGIDEHCPARSCLHPHRRVTRRGSGAGASSSTRWRRRARARSQAAEMLSRKARASSKRPASKA